MTSRRPTYLTPGFHIQHSVCVVLSVLILSFFPTLGVCRAEETLDPYDVLCDVIMVRKDSEGIAFGRNAVGPSIYGRSRFPFDDETFPKLTAALDRFSALSQAKIKAYGNVKRALLQRHLWKVFDATGPSRRFRSDRSHAANRTESQKKIASLIQTPR